MSASTQATAHALRHNGNLSSVGDELAELKETVSAGVHDATQSGKRVVRAAGTAALSAAAGLRESTARTRDQIGRTISERPFASVAIAAGVGAMLGAGLMLMRRR